MKLKFIYFLIFICLMLFLPANAQNSYPKPVNDYVNDFARVINPADSAAIGKMFSALEYQTGIEAVVVTINSIYDYRTGDISIESFATKLFNTWGVGHKKENNGVLILVATADRKCRISLGGGWGRSYDGAMQQVIDEKMLPCFKSGDYSRGIYEGARGVVEKLTRKVPWYEFYTWHIILGIIIIICVLAGVSCARSGNQGWGWAFFTITGTILFFLIRMFLSGRSRSGFGGGSSFGGGASGSW